MKTPEEYILLLIKRFPTYKFLLEGNVIEIDLKKDKEYARQLEWEIIKVVYPFNNILIK